MGERERLDLEEIRAIIRLATEADIAELVVDAPHVKVHVKKTAAAVPPATADAAPPSGATGRAPVPGEEPAARYVPIVAPMVGTFYRAPKPDAPPFVNEGETVQRGQTVCVLEAMKMFNEIPSEVAGRIVRVLAENGAPVEYGQPLFLVDPAA
ncbi:MAG TPA: acetyl-CoA carboxylase biotin carboxyl carrier protein [bacterium]|nr:acetyl-CoA carboxylase biotin carboxyl carrier protein [bacterium]